MPPYVKPYENEMGKKNGSVVLDNDLILVDFNNPTAVISQHLVINFVDNAFILETGEIIDFFQLHRIDQVTGFID
jgi:hypothetical protein